MIVDDLKPLARSVDSINLDPRNANTHDERSVSAIAASLERFGQRKPVVVRREGMVLEAGEGTLLAARQLGWTEIAAVLVDDDPTTAVGFSIADNRTGELSAFNEERLQELVRELAAEEADLVAALDLDGLLSDLENPADQPDEGEGGSAGLGTPVIQYQIIFDDEEQKDRWYRFLRHLKRQHPDAETVAERLHAELGKLSLDESGEED